MVQLSHPHMTTGKIIALTRWTYVSKVMSLLFNMLPRLLIAFLPRSKRLLISWLQSSSAVILEPKKRKCVTVSIVCPSIFHEVAWSEHELCSTTIFQNTVFTDNQLFIETQSRLMVYSYVQVSITEFRFLWVDWQPTGKQANRWTITYVKCWEGNSHSAVMRHESWWDYREVDSFRKWHLDWEPKGEKKTTL